MRHLQPYVYIDTIARTGSIRQAADLLAISPSALNRRVLSLEDELGVPIFERLPRGVRLSAAGELLIHHIRTQLSEIARVKSQIADLSGMRRGHVSIASSQALLPYFLPAQIAAYRAEHPAVTFGVHLRDRAAAERSLADHSADLAAVFEPVNTAAFETLLCVEQPVYCVMSPDHPLATTESPRLHECLNYPLALPTSPYGVRHLLEAAVRRFPLAGLKLEPHVESDSFEFLRNYVMNEGLISFQIPLGLSMEREAAHLAIRPLDPHDVPAGKLYIGQLHGRTLPIAATRFADQLVRALEGSD